MITAKRYIIDHGYPLLEMEIDGKLARIGPDNRRNIFEEIGAVFLGSAFEGMADPPILPADPAAGRSELVLDGFTTDPAVQRLYRQYLEDLKNDTFAPGDVE